MIKYLSLAQFPLGTLLQVFFGRALYTEEKMFNEVEIFINYLIPGV